MGGRNWLGLGCAGLIGAAIAFPAGMMFAGREAVRQEAGPPADRGSRTVRPAGRNPYSPDISGDPYVLDRQRRLVEALEAQCRNQRENCAEAEQARTWMDRQDASN